jgi:hypothetical protein
MCAYTGCLSATPLEVIRRSRNCADYFSSQFNYTTTRISTQPISQYQTILRTHNHQNSTSAMPHFLQSLIAIPSVPTYDCTRASVGTDETCHICREPFSSDDCMPIQMTSCGHIIGDKCFEEWTRRQPGICPYWNHHLPHHAADGEHMICTLVSSRIGSLWFHVFEYYILDLACFSIRKEIQYVMRHPDQYPDANLHIVMLIIRNVALKWTVGLLLGIFWRLDGHDLFSTNLIGYVEDALAVVIMLVNTLIAPTLAAILFDWFKWRSTKANAFRVRLR